MIEAFSGQEVSSDLLWTLDTANRIIRGELHEVVGFDLDKYSDYDRQFFNEWLDAQLGAQPEILASYKSIKGNTLVTFYSKDLGGNRLSRWIKEERYPHYFLGPDYFHKSLENLGYERK